MGDQAARPPRKQKHQQNQRECGSTGLCVRVSLQLDKVHWVQEKKDSQSSIEEQSEQVCSAKAAGLEQRQRNHRRTYLGLHERERNQGGEAGNQASENQR